MGTNNYHSDHHGGYGKSNSRSHAKLPDGYLENGYYSDPEKLRLKPEYIVEYPEKIAEELGNEFGREINKRSQLRKFYDHLLRVQKKMNLTNSDISVVMADLTELVPSVAYAKERKLVSELFEQFIRKNVSNISDGKDLTAFTKHFEALIAFSKKDG